MMDGWVGGGKEEGMEDGVGGMGRRRAAGGGRTDGRTDGRIDG